MSSWVLDEREERWLRMRGDAIYRVERLPNRTWLASRLDTETGRRHPLGTYVTADEGKARADQHHDANQTNGET